MVTHLHCKFPDADEAPRIVDPTWKMHFGDYNDDRFLGICTCSFVKSASSDERTSFSRVLSSAFWNLPDSLKIIELIIYYYFLLGTAILSLIH